MSGKGRVGKEVVLSDRSARCRAWLKMDLSSLQSCGLQKDASENDPKRWTGNEARTLVLRVSPTFPAEAAPKPEGEETGEVESRMQ